MRFIYRFMLITLMSGLYGYARGQSMDQEIYIPVEDSRLYLRLVGNANGPIILNLHGGPGAFSGFDHEINRHYLEDKYLVGYLDQRGGGKSDPCKDPRMLNMEQFVRDLDKVVDSLKHRFPDQSVNLIGSSWGGTLGLLYMIRHQDKINSYACISGKADGVYPIFALIEHEETLAKKHLKSAKSSMDSAKYQNILAKLDTIKKDDLTDFYAQVNQLKHDFPKALGFDVYWANKEALARAGDLGKDPAYYQRAHYTKAEFDKAMEKFDYVNGVFRNDSAYNHLNIIEEIAVITKPVLVMQGDQDYSIGIKQGNMIYKALKGIPKSDKSLHILPNAAHNLNLEATEEYYKNLLAFFDRYN